uniref:GBR3 n=1 Tax=Panax ginseng TaxID=4054 RepID=Q84TC4_PANGI|nr:GBR3 [Panax ginseng]
MITQYIMFSSTDIIWINDGRATKFSFKMLDWIVYMLGFHLVKSH